MSAKVPPFSAIGQQAKEVLTGAKQGIYQYNKKYTFASKTNEGVDFVTTLTQTGANSPAEVSFKLAKKYGDTALSGTVNQNGKIVLVASQYNLTPGLTLTANGTYPDADSGKLNVDYTLPHVTFKSTVGATQTPPVEASVTAGYPHLFAGFDAAVNTANNSLTKWTVGAGYTQKEYQVGVLLLDHGEKLKATYAHSIDASKDFVVAGEINHNITKGADTTIIVGLQTKLNSGALAKVRLDSESVLSVHWEAPVHTNTTLGLSAQFNVAKLDAAPKLGFAASTFA